MDTVLDETVFRGRRLAIVGSICRDVKIGAIRPGPHLLEDGETPTELITETIGGGGANSALAAAALGADVRFCGKVGADSLGQRLEQSLTHCGVKTFIRRDPQMATGSSVVLSYYHNGRLTVSPSIPVQQYKNTAGTGDLLSVCMMLLHGCDEIPPEDRLRLANTIVAEFIEGKRGVIPELA